MRRIVRRAAGALLALLLANLIAFAILNLAPGDAALTLVGESATGVELQAVRQELGLEAPILARYLAYLGRAVRGDLGRSWISGQPVTEVIGARFASTLLLAVAATLLAALAGLLAGIVAAARKGGWIDRTLMAAAALGLALPGFGAAMLLTLVFSLHLRLLPVAGGGTPAHLVLPALTLAAPMTAVIARLSRSSLLDAARAEWALAARAKGLTGVTVWRKHILRNALIPVVTVVGLNFGHLLGGAFVVETIFGWPGLGRLLVQAVFDRDAPLILGAVWWLALLFQGANLLVDLAYGWLDPRVGREAV